MFIPKTAVSESEELTRSTINHLSQEYGLVYRTRLGWSFSKAVDSIYRDLDISKENWEEDPVDALLSLGIGISGIVVTPALVPYFYLRSFYDLRKIDEPKTIPAPSLDLTD